MLESLKGNRYITTIHAIVSGIIKLSQIAPLPKDRKVYRGLGGDYQIGFGQAIDLDVKVELTLAFYLRQRVAISQLCTPVETAS